MGPASRVLHAPTALLPGGWARNVAIEVEPDGNIAGIRTGAAIDRNDERVAGPVLPGLVDAHCHAFQRAMVGLAQRLHPGESSFWGWREVMYGFAARLGPEQLWAIAAQLYVELLKGGYTTVCEFHYLHHQPDGSGYDDPALMGVVLHEAAREAGIALTLLPALYMTAGFDGAPAEPGQRRFVNTPDRLLVIHDRLERLFRDDPDRRLGIALHSLRAVPAAAIGELMAALPRNGPRLPVHIHVAEQEREVAECRAATGAAPIERLYAVCAPGPDWCLVHATHASARELAMVAGSGAVVALCPTTEADLGDGLFPLAQHLAAGGRIAVGSDSNVATAWREELRLLEWGQRLARRRRLIAASPAEPHTGARLVRAALHGGTQAAARPTGRLAPGFRADLVVLDRHEPTLAARHDDHALDALLFGPAERPVRDVMVGGRWVIRDGAHAAERAIAEGWRAAMAELAD
jgi:formimidoylglutamate deiminase